MYTIQRNVKKQVDKWGPDQQTSFDELKEACCNTQMLVYTDYNQTFILHTDRSLNELGDVSDNSDARRSPTKSEGNYSAYKVEFLALK